jgi:hypothetical protein
LTIKPRYPCQIISPAGDEGFAPFLSWRQR